MANETNRTAMRLAYYMTAVRKMRIQAIATFFMLALTASICGQPTSVSKIESRAGNSAERVEYFPNGNIKAKWTERIGSDNSAVKHGVFQNYYDNGQLKSRVEYLDGRENGLMTTWQNDGKLISTLSYKDGLLDGICTYYDSDGRRMSSGTYRQGKEDGVFTLFYPSGRIQGKTTWKDGVQHGRYEVWWENGKMAKLGQTKDGLVDGHWKVWDSTGRLTLEEEYFANVLVKSIKHDSTSIGVDTNN